MVRHVILWTLKETVSEQEKNDVKQGIKRGLEGLVGTVPGLTALTVYTEPLESSNADVMLDAVFTDFDALRGYAVHPAHVAVANGSVRPYTASRTCMDFEEV